MTPVFDAEKSSDIMRRVKSNKNKSTELKLIEVFKESGITGWRRNYRVKGHPDFAFLQRKIAAFVDDVSDMDMTVETLVHPTIRNTGRKSKSEISSMIRKLP